MTAYGQVVTDASLLKGIVKLRDLVQKMKEERATHAAITNDTLYGAVAFHDTLAKEGLVPIQGLEVAVQTEEEERPTSLYVYADGDEGFQSLLKLSSAANVRSERSLPIRWLAPYVRSCAVIYPVRAFQPIRPSIVEALKSGSDRFVFGLHTYDVSIDPSVEERAREAGEQEQVDVIAYRDIRYIAPKERAAYDVATAIRHNCSFDELGDQRLPYEAHSLSFDEWKEQWEDETYVERTHTFFERLSPVTTFERSPHMPTFPMDEGNAASRLKTMCEQRLRSIGKWTPPYEQRLHKEWTTITNMGFEHYFLIVADFMDAAREKGIMTGPGRGSSASSLVAYALGITEVDPLEHGLLFERFLNEQRVTLPDIDIDFEDRRRSEVIDYVVETYGVQHVAQIGTFGTLSFRAVLRNVLRIFDYEKREIDTMIEELAQTKQSSVRQALVRSPRLKDRMKEDETFLRAMHAATVLEGIPRNVSTHAAGVVISDEPLVQRVPLQKGTDGPFVTQWAMGDVEQVGLLKMDFLGLRNLTILRRMYDTIRYEEGTTLNLQTIPLDDDDTLRIFREADTLGIFQFESPGMRRALKEIAPTNFSHIVVANALYRPGPMANIPTFARRKRGEENVRWIDPSVASILGETYGIIVYQEQIMQMAQTVARFSFAEADLLRRSISKKDHETMEREKRHFVEAAIDNGYERAVAEQLFHWIGEFAAYGFPKSHAVAYSLISYQLAYCKAHYPAHFYAAQLTYASSEQFPSFLREMKERSIPLLRPSIRESRYAFTVEKGNVRVGLKQIKGLPRDFYRAWSNVRKQGVTVRSVAELTEALSDTKLTDHALEALVYSGALDDFNIPREQLLDVVDVELTHERFGRFGQLKRPAVTNEMSAVEKVERERELLGFYISEHPIEMLRKSESFYHVPIAQWQTPNRRVKEALVHITNVKEIRTKRGEKMAFVTFQDESGEIEGTVFPTLYRHLSFTIEKGFAVIEGKVNERRGRWQIVVDALRPYQKE